MLSDKDTFLPSRLASLKAVIKEDESAAKDFKHLQFTEGVINGRIAVLEPEEETAKRAKAKKAANRAIMGANAAEKAAQKAEFKNFLKRVGKKSRK